MRKCLTEKEIRRRFARITVWRRGDQRAPHKPLALLYALARASRGEERLTDFITAYEVVRKLLETFGPGRQGLRAEYPLWRLQNDDVWEVLGAEDAAPRRSNIDPRISELRRLNPSLGFPEELHKPLVGRQTLIVSLANEILHNHFPESLHEDILSAVGLERRTNDRVTSQRDPAFRDKILIAYEYRCGVCGFDVRLGGVPLGLEAAHIKWHQAHGPDTEQNGIAMCSLHHKLFDLGAFSIFENQNIRVSQRVTGTAGFSEILMAFHNRRLIGPQMRGYRPAPEFLGWHHREVFHAPAR